MIESRFKTFLEQLVPFSEADFVQTMLYFRALHLKKGANLVQQTQICKQIAYIGQGLMRTFYFDDKGDDTTYCFCTENGFTTSLRSFLLQQPSALNIQALEDTQLLVIDYADLQHLYQVSKYWQTIGRLLTEKEYLSLEGYIAVLNGNTAREKYAWLLQQQPQVIQKAPVKYVASYLGISRETLSRIRREVTA